MDDSARAQELTSRLSSTVAEATFLPGLKATISFYIDIGESSRPQARPVISPSSMYHYGSKDLLLLNDALYQLADRSKSYLMFRVFLDWFGIHFKLHIDPETRSPSPKDFAASNLSPSLPDDCCRPLKIKIVDSDKVSPEHVPTVFLEGLNWMREKTWQTVEACLWLWHRDVAVLVDCAKSVSKLL